MRYSFAIVLGLGMGAVVFAQERAPVVLVWGEYLAATNQREAPGTRSYMDNIARALDAIGLCYDRTKDSEVEKGALEGRKFAIFPYNANLSDAEQAEIRRFVARGGKIWASFTRDPVLAELLGVKPGQSVRPESPDGFAVLMFTDKAPTGMPETVIAGSWYSHRITLQPTTQVIANWGDAQGNDTGAPALTMNQNGYYHAHVVLGSDDERKGRMFLALVGHFFPELWKQAVQKAITNMAAIHGLDSWDTAAEAIKQAKAQGTDVAFAEKRLANAARAKQAAQELFVQGKYAEAIEQAGAAKESLRSVMYPLAPSREGELRAVWISGGQVDDWQAVMKDLADAGFNAVFPALCDAGGADYQSDVLPESKDYRCDQLAACLEAAEKYNIEVHPWRINWRLSRGTNQRKDELRAAGRLTKSVDGSEGDWLCPSDERNFRLEVDAMLEMAQKYPTHGIHFDYIRYHNSRYCYCEKCRNNFQRDANVTVANWPKDVLAGGADYEAFQDWRRAQITRVVREVHRRAHAARPEIVVSAAVFSNWPHSRVSIGQDAAAWAEEGIVDLLMPMTYTNSNQRLAKLTNEHVELTRGRAILAEGIGVHSSHSQFTGPNQLIQQIETARRLGTDGFCVFHYGTRLKQGFLAALAEGCTGAQTFTPMLRPPASFKIDGTAEGTWTFDPDKKHALQATVRARGPWRRSVASLEATLFLQGLDGRNLRTIGQKQVVRSGGEGNWSVELTLEPGAYRLAISGQIQFDDGSTRRYICRSRPVHVLTTEQ